jgi:putative DNA primase/helicase
MPETEKPPHPVALGVCPDAIPADLKALDQWVIWRFFWKEDRQKYDKPPLNARGGNAASDTDPQTWSTSDQAMWACKEGLYDGVGFVLTAMDDFFCIDLDHCRDPTTGVIPPNVQAIIHRFNTYTEISPSDTGLHIWGRGRLPGRGRKKGSIEVYDRARYLTVTGHHLAGTPMTIEPRQAELDAFLAEVFGMGEPSPEQDHLRGENGDAPHLDDDALIDKALAAKNGPKFARLWGGDTSDYPSHSEADLALCEFLAFWTRDEGQLDRLFRRSGLYREKWERADYRGPTMAEALARVTDYWKPSQARSVYRAGTPSVDGSTSREAEQHQASPSQGNGQPSTDTDEEHFTDLGNARRFVRLWQTKVHYVTTWQKWVTWTDTAWQLDHTKEVDRLARETIKAMYAEAAKLEKPKARKALASWAMQSESRGKLEAMIALAQAELPIPLTHERLDTDPWAFNCANGTIDLRTGTLRPHRREDLLMKQSPVPFDPQALCQRWLQFLEEIMTGDKELIDYLQRAVGSSLTADVRDQCLFFLHGSGANGKSVFLLTILSLMADYGMQSIPELLMVRNNEQHPTERADLFGKRFVATVEVESGKALAETLVKQLTGGDLIRARRMREDFWEFPPTHKLWFAANHKPIVRGTDHAIWRRIKDPGKNNLNICEPSAILRV